MGRIETEKGKKVVRKTNIPMQWRALPIEP